jgi:hypothetical protein
MMALAKAVSASPWNGVTITTAILSLAAIVITLIVLGVTWANIAKPYWKNETSRMRFRWHVLLVNRGAGMADDVRVNRRVKGGWVETEQWETRAHNETLGANITAHDIGPTVWVRVTWGTHPLPWLRRWKFFRIKVPAAREYINPTDELGVR